MSFGLLMPYCFRAAMACMTPNLLVCLHPDTRWHNKPHFPPVMDQMTIFERRMGSKTCWIFNRKYSDVIDTIIRHNGSFVCTDLTIAARTRSSRVVSSWSCATSMRIFSSDVFSSSKRSTNGSSSVLARTCKLLRLWLLTNTDISVSTASKGTLGRLKLCSPLQPRTLLHTSSQYKEGDWHSLNHLCPEFRKKVDQAGVHCLNSRLSRIPARTNKHFASFHPLFLYSKQS